MYYRCWTSILWTWNPVMCYYWINSGLFIYVLLCFKKFLWGFFFHFVKVYLTVLVLAILKEKKKRILLSSSTDICFSEVFSINMQICTEWVYRLYRARVKTFRNKKYLKSASEWSCYLLTLGMIDTNYQNPQSLMMQFCLLVEYMKLQR